MAMRGVQKPHSTTVTSCMLGDFKDDARTRNEFLHLVRSAPYGHVAGPALSENLAYTKRTRTYESDGVHLERSLEGHRSVQPSHPPHTIQLHT
jgi:hypothetical protein